VSASGIEIASLVVSIVGTVATVGALIAAITIGVREARQFREEAVIRDQERRDAEARERRKQAECVSAMIVVDSSPSLLAGVDDKPGLYDASIDVTNASPLPLYNVKVGYPGDRDGFLTVRDVSFIEGHGKGHIHLRGRHLDRTRDKEPVVVAFRDAAGVYWERCADGHLVEHESEPFTHLTKLD
jgi:hypothetical protein